jgi:hypothetical protein
MPTALRLLLYTTAVCVSLFGFMFYEAQPLAQQSVAVHQQTAAQRWVAESMVELEQKAAGQHRTAAYEACARDIRADYDDDPEQAYRWVLTLCH